MRFKFLTLILIAISFLSLWYVFATWEEPKEPPPAGNVTLPAGANFKIIHRVSRLNVNSISCQSDEIVTGGGCTVNFGYPFGNGFSCKSSTGHTYVWCLTNDLARESKGFLVNFRHSEADCTAAGGGIATTTDGSVKFCRFTSSSCPSGWTQYLNWSTTEDNRCCGGSSWFCVGTCCNSGYHTWGDTSREVCNYRYPVMFWCQLAPCLATRTQIGCY